MRPKVLARNPGADGLQLCGTDCSKILHIIHCDGRGIHPQRGQERGTAILIGGGQEWIVKLVWSGLYAGAKLWYMYKL